MPDDILEAFGAVAIEVAASIASAETLPIEERAAARKLARETFIGADTTALVESSNVWGAALREANLEYANDPSDDVRRTADLMQAEQLSRGVGPTQAKSLLWTRGIELLALDQIDRAAVYANAARLAGTPNHQLEDAIERKRDATLPNRVKGLAQRAAAEAYAANAWETRTTVAANIFSLLDDDRATADRTIALKMKAYGTAKAQARPYVDPTGLPAPKDRSLKHKPGSNVRFDSRTRGIPERHSDG